MIGAVEEAVGLPMTGLTSPLPSYINRVYEFQAREGTRLIAKFYRPGRWTRDALDQEHEFVSDCALDEIPVISPMVLKNGSTIGSTTGGSTNGGSTNGGSTDGIYFAVFPKRFGRDFEVTEEEDWRRLGRVIARIHIAGSKKAAGNRVRLHPDVSTAEDVRQLVEGGFISARLAPDFKKVCGELLDICLELFEDIEFIRLHGDCHRGNIIYRPDEGLMVIDFDDMMTGPPVQDLWLLLPEHAVKCQEEIRMILEGYEMFRNFDRRTLRLIEPLRAMRIIYFLAWCSKQADDFKFKKNFPGWGSDGFWQKEIADLGRQLQTIKKDLDRIMP
jgi:Ser/Thr protein kinase RdoA (MazF antagonist)